MTTDQTFRVFVTVGAQMPFDRLVRAVDEWAGTQDGRGVEFFAQIGPDGYHPKSMPWTEFIEPATFKQRVDWCSVLIAHAGMGSILTALQAGKPILVLPRKGDLRETRNDHQIATAKRFRDMGKVAVAMEESDLAHELTRLRGLAASDRISPDASPQLIGALRDFIHGS
jgi:UDP-N-acetylglucosamine transferase subunit ALG13